MPPWLVSFLVSLVVGLLLFFANRLTTKSNSDLSKSIKGCQDDISQLKEDSWSTDERVQLAERLTKIESLLEHFKTEVDFTKTTHQEFLRLLEKALIPVAHSPHTPKLDLLLERRDRGEELSSAEWKELIRQLGEEAKATTLPGKQVAYNGLRAIYLTHLRQAERREAQAQAQTK
jgi:Sec-independent protein translocase protein TatA